MREYPVYWKCISVEASSAGAARCLQYAEDNHFRPRRPTGGLEAGKTGSVPGGGGGGRGGGERVGERRARKAGRFLGHYVIIAPHPTPGPSSALLPSERRFGFHGERFQRLTLEKI